MSGPGDMTWRAESASVLTAVIQKAHGETADAVKSAEQAKAAIKALDDAGYMIVTRFEPDNHHNAAACPYCTPRSPEAGASTS